MKKISYLELSTILLTIIIAFNSGINIYILKKEVSIDSWITIILAYIIGLIPLFLTFYISNYRQDLTLYEKNISLFGSTLGLVINILISTILFIIGVTLLYNIISFITTQFLYHTPMLISSLLLISLAVYCSTKGINVICHTSLILTIINIVIFILSTSSLIPGIKFDYLLPFLKTDTSKIIITALKITVINTLPLISILIVPQKNITNQKKYHKAIIISYIIGTIISFITITSTIGTIGIYLTKTFEYAEYIALKKIKLFGFLERIENIVSIEWITCVYIYITLIIYNISQSIIKKHSQNKKSLIIINIAIGTIIIIASNYLFQSITTFNNYLTNTFIYIVMLLFPIYIIIAIRISIKR